MSRCALKRRPSLPGLAIVGLVALLLVWPAAAPAAPPEAKANGSPQSTLTDIEDEVMCPICGTLLELSESPQAQRERVFVRGLIARGLTKAQIKDALVTEYGSGVLALPKSSGFSLSAYLVPIVAFLLAAVGLAIAVGRWRRATPDAGPDRPAPAGPDDEDAKRLDADLARYDL